MGIMAQGALPLWAAPRDKEAAYGRADGHRSMRSHACGHQHYRLGDVEKGVTNSV